MTKTQKKPAEKPHVLDEQQDRFFDTMLYLDGFDEGDGDDGKQVRVRFDSKTASLARQIQMGLRQSRKVRRPEEINRFDVHVRRMRELTDKGRKLLDENEDDELEDLPRGAFVMNATVVDKQDSRNFVEAVQAAMEDWDRDVIEDGLKVAMLWDNFDMRRLKNGGTAIMFREDLLTESIDPEIFERSEDDDALTAARNGVYPGPTIDQSNPAEVRVQMMYALFRENPTLTYRINVLVDKAMNLIASIYYGDEIEKGDMDEIGFHSSGLDGDLAERRKARTERRGTGKGEPAPEDVSNGDGATRISVTGD